MPSLADDRAPLEDRFLALVDGIRRHGLTPAVVELEDRFEEAEDPHLRGQIAKLLGFYFLRGGDLGKAIHWSDAARQWLPDDAENLYNAVFARFQAGRWDEVIALAKAAADRFAAPLDFCNLLSTTLGALGRLDEAVEFGTRALALKEACATADAWAPGAVAGPAWDAARPERNIISFSLFGALAKYTEGAVLNARAAPFLYPGWTCRFYIDDSVPQAVQGRLAEAGAQVMLVGGLPQDPYGPFWRFLVADDPAVDRYIIRDADSLLNTRERVAVDEWLASGRRFHVMRDHFDHCELVLAGMWGGVRGALPPIVPTAQRWFAAQQQILGKTADQLFLREALWPTIRQSVLTHDSLFAFGERQDFPALGRLPPGLWVGCQWSQMVAAPGRMSPP